MCITQGRRVSPEGRNIISLEVDVRERRLDVSSERAVPCSPAKRDRNEASYEH